MQSHDKIDLSIILPIYNVEQYLAECLESICLAVADIEYKEIICVNDGSTDNSLSIINAYQKKYDFIVLIDKKNAGYGAAINSGLKASNAKYITIVESDDKIHTGAYSRLLKTLNNTPEADFIKTPYMIWVDGKIKRTVEMQDAPKDIFSVNDYPSALMFTPSIWSAVYRKSFLEKNKIDMIETPGASYQDAYFSALCFLLGGKMLYDNEAYYLYRNDRMEASRHNKNNTLEVVVIFDWLAKVLKSRDAFSGTNKALFFSVFFKRIIWFFSTVGDDKQILVFNTTRDRFKSVLNNQDKFTQVLQPLGKSEKKMLYALKENDFTEFKYRQQLFASATFFKKLIIKSKKKARLKGKTK